ncbi:MAG TPA: SPFH domain-containing protein, partial [Chloroflexia bacterium]|nr:SPFH domain-containing protein [Chloroflexia bacterium]
DEEERTMWGVIFALVIFLIVAAMLFMGIKSIRIQHEGKIGVVEAWGRFSRVVVPGRFVVWPWEHKVADLPLQIFEWETGPQKLTLKGGTALTMTAIIHYQLEHAHKTPGAPRPARIIGKSPAPVGSNLGAAPGHSTPAATTSHNRGSIGIDSLEPGTRPKTARRVAPAAAPAASSAGTAASPGLVRRMLGRTGDQLDIAAAAYRAKYMVHDWQEATHREAVAVFQQVFSKVGVADDINGNVNWHETLGERVREHLQEKTELWGVQILDVAFKDVTFTEFTMRNLHAESTAEREGRIRTKLAENYQKIAELLNLSSGELLRWRQVEVMHELGTKSHEPRIMITSDMMGRGMMDSPPPVNPLLNGGDARGLQAADRRGYLGNEPPPPPLNGQNAPARITGPDPMSSAGTPAATTAPQPEPR